TENYIYSSDSDDPKNIPKLENLLQIASKQKKSVLSLITENETFSPTAANLTDLINKNRALLNEALQKSEKYDHLSKEELESVSENLKDCEKWLETATAIRSTCPLPEECSVKVGDINEKTRELKIACDLVFNRKKPDVKKDDQNGDDNNNGENGDGKDIGENGDDNNNGENGDDNNNGENGDDKDNDQEKEEK
ncbi:Heat shock 70 kDa protein 4L, partial [Bonamia ostreae]